MPPVVEACNKTEFLGLRPWYYYLPKERFEGCNVKDFILLPGADDKSDIPLILLAIVDDLLRIAALVAIGFVILGAFRLIASQGNPEDAAKAQSTIINALIGLAIAIVAAAFVSFLGSRLGG